MRPATCWYRERALRAYPLLVCPYLKINCSELFETMPSTMAARRLFKSEPLNFRLKIELEAFAKTIIKQEQLNIRQLEFLSNRTVKMPLCFSSGASAELTWVKVGLSLQVWRSQLKSQSHASVRSRFQSEVLGFVRISFFGKRSLCFR